MTVSLEHTRTGDVAVLHGVDTDAALAHLCRSLVTGSVFDTYRALVVDLGGLTELPEDVRRALDEASEACLHRRQYLGTVSDPGGIVPAIRQAREWLRLADGQPTSTVRVVVSAALLPARAALALAAAAADTVRQVLPRH